VRKINDSFEHYKAAKHLKWVSKLS